MGQKVGLDLRPARGAAIVLHAIVQRVEGLGLAAQVIRHDVQADVAVSAPHKIVVDERVAVRLGGVAEGDGGDGHAGFLAPSLLDVWALPGLGDSGGWPMEVRGEPLRQARTKPEGSAQEAASTHGRDS
ncbi:hypothetical protein FQZ97_1139740 [compost metagenome]